MKVDADNLPALALALRRALPCDAVVWVGTQDVDVAGLLGREELPDEPVLTARERQMLELVGTGLTASAIGHRTGISARTVQKHLQNAYAKLGCGDRLSAVLKIQMSLGTATRSF